ncbi:ShlB/FhaC/HecB family hemolysin secretion/activation protein [Asaia sp. BMEF1]|uniref:ShlB/FhaC/HecB family hemolysin secretion/activation protein n=1 Tax=Asaia sp. BMEF1 TaxID=3155932 RepID=UPI003F67F451
MTIFALLHISSHIAAIYYKSDNIPMNSLWKYRAECVSASGVVGVIALHLLLWAVFSFRAEATTALTVAPGGVQNQFQSYQQRKLQMDLLSLPEARSALGGAPGVHGSRVGRCFEVRDIEIRGHIEYIQKEAQKVKDIYQGKCLSLPDIDAVVKYMNGALIAQGYITSRAYLPTQSLSSGKLVVVLVAGRVSQLRISGRPARRIAQMAFPDIEGGVLTLPALEQGMENITRLPHSSARLRIEPGSESGTSQVIVNSPKTRILHGQVWIDNYSQRITGREVGHAQVSAENALGLADLWSVEYDHSLVAGAGKGNTSFLLASGVVPFGYWTVFGSWWRSQDNYPLQTWSLPLSVQGLRDDWLIGATRVVARNSFGVTTVQGSFERKSFGSSLEGETIEVTRGRQAYVNVQISESSRALNALWYVTLGTKIAFNGAGTWSYFVSPGSAEPHTAFLRPSLDVDGYKPLPRGIFWHMALHGELSTRYQFPINQLQIGGAYTVRGFLQNILLGNEGGYMRNDFSWQLPASSLGCPVSSWVCRRIFDRAEIYAALDFGIVRVGFTTPSMSPLQKGGEMLGAGLGLRKTSGPFFWDVALTHSLYTSPLPSEGLITLFQIGIKS